MTYKTEFGDYDKEYGSLDYKGAVVLDIGADYGSTAAYFLKRGASAVSVSEINPSFQERLADYALRTPGVSMAPPLTEANAGRLLAECVPDIVKCDCEGRERFFLGVAPQLMAAPHAWVMETHSEDLYNYFRGLFALLGYVVETVEEFPNNPPERHRKVITAVRG